jgi:superfamily I DNA/RNA helicase
VRDWTGLCSQAESLILSGAVQSPYTAVIVDELQDLRPPDQRFVRALCAQHPGNLMLCGDAGQRIYAGGFSLGSLGLDVRGRSSVLRVNYRTTAQIRRLSDQLLGLTADDMDGGQEERGATRSLLRGPAPALCGYKRRSEETDAAVRRVREWIDAGLQPEAVGVFARTSARLNEIGGALGHAGIGWSQLTDSDGVSSGVQVGTMHRAKGLEFKAVLVLDCSEGVVPHSAAIKNKDDPQDRESAIARERQLLYVAMTRARDELAVTWSGSPSPFISKLVEDSYKGSK